MPNWQAGSQFLVLRRLLRLSEDDELVHGTHSSTRQEGSWPASRTCGDGRRVRYFSLYCMT